jgi:LysR family transcriptional regulator, hydrogen peroxide-inducible genes activator
VNLPLANLMFAPENWLLIGGIALLLFGKRLPEVGRSLGKGIVERHLSRRVVCRTTQMLTILELVGLGVGVSMIPAMAAAADRSGRCRYLPLRPGKPTRQVAVAWRQGRTRPLAATRFVEIVINNLRRGLHSPQSRHI